MQGKGVQSTLFPLLVQEGQKIQNFCNLQIKYVDYSIEQESEI